VHRDAKRIAIFICAAALAAALASACKRGAASGGAKDVAATINGKDIMLSEVDNTIKQQTGGQQASLSPLELGAARLQVLDDLIKQEVLFQRADKEKLLPTDDEVSQVISSQKQQVGSQEEFQKALKESGQTEEGLREVVRKRLAMQKLLDRIGSKVDPPSDKEIEDFYNANRERYVSARGVQLSAIIVDPQDNGLTNDAKSDIEVQNKINIVYQRLKSGGDFATIAREQSEDPNTTRNGGDIGFYTEDDLKRAGFPQELIAKFFGNEMQVGDYTPPTKGSDGRMSIWKLTSRRLQSENLTLDNPEVRKDAADTIINQRKQIVNAALLEVAMREAKIENKLAESMLTSANSLSSLRPAGAPTATPAAANPSSSASPAAHGATPATNASSAAKPNVNAANHNPAAPAATRNTNAARPAGNANR
jgi:peptidyl-prolyl cis-trans isomerase SurA